MCSSDFHLYAWVWFGFCGCGLDRGLFVRNIYIQREHSQRFSRFSLLGNSLTDARADMRPFQLAGIVAKVL